MIHVQLHSYEYLWLLVVQNENRKQCMVRVNINFSVCFLYIHEIRKSGKQKIKMKKLKLRHWTQSYFLCYQGTVAPIWVWLKETVAQRCCWRSLNFQLLLWLLYKMKLKHSSSGKMDGNCYIFANSCWEMLKGYWTATGQCSKVIGSRWEMPRGYWIASGQFLGLLEGR